MENDAATHTRQWLLTNEAHTQALAQALVTAMQNTANGVSLHINLHGDLGAGKTTFTRYVLRAMGITGRIKSPSYAIVEQYQTSENGMVYHFDFYRFNEPQEWEDAGFREPFTEAGLKLVEWPDKAQPMLPVADIDLHLTTHLTSLNTDTAVAARQCAATAHTNTGRKILDVWNHAPQST